MAEMLTQGRRCGFSKKLPCLFVSFNLGRNLPWFMQFSWRPCNPRGHTSRLYVAHRHSSLSSNATHATYASLPLKKYLRSVYFRKQVHILLCHPRNLGGKSKGSSSRYLTFAPEAPKSIFVIATYVSICAWLPTIKWPHAKIDLVGSRINPYIYIYIYIYRSKYGSNSDTMK